MQDPLTHHRSDLRAGDELQEMGRKFHRPIELASTRGEYH